MDKVYGSARVLAVVLAIAAAFLTVPSIAVALLALGAISAFGNTPEDNVRVFLVAIVLSIGAKSLDAVPLIGVRLDAIFTGIGTAAIGASLVGVTLGLARRIHADWAPPAKEEAKAAATA
jgi:hypothetical protein